MNANIFESQNKENLMQFNPLFLPANNFAENPGITKTFKLSNSTYLFSDIIKVFTGADLIKNQEDSGLNLPQDNLSNQQLQAANIYSLNIQNAAPIPDKQKDLSKTINSVVNNLSIIIELINKLSGSGQLNLQSGISGLNSFKSGILPNEKMITSDELTALLNNFIKLTGSANKTKNITGNGDTSKAKNKVDDNQGDLIINILNSLNANRPVIINIVNENEILKIELQKTDIVGQDEKSISLNPDDSNSGVSLKEDKFDFKLINNTGYKESMHIPADSLSIEALRQNSELNKLKSASNSGKIEENILSPDKIESLSSENGGKIVSDGQSKIALFEDSAFPADLSKNSNSLPFIKLKSGSNAQNIFKLKVEISKIEKPSQLPKSEITPDLSNKIFGKPKNNLSKNVSESVSIEKLVASKNSLKNLNKVSNELNNYSIKSDVNKIKNTAVFKNEIKSELKDAEPIVKNKNLKAEIQFNDSIKSQKDLKEIDKVSNKDLKILFEDDKSNPKSKLTKSSPIAAIFDESKIEKLVSSKNNLKNLNKVSNELNNYSIKSDVNKIKNTIDFKNEIKSELKDAEPIVKNKNLKAEIQFNDSIKSQKDLKEIDKVSNKDLKILFEDDKSNPKSKLTKSSPIAAIFDESKIEKLVASKNSLKNLNKVSNELNNYSIKSDVNKIKNTIDFKNEIKSELKDAEPIVKNKNPKVEIQLNDSINSKKDLKETSKISTSGDENKFEKDEIKNNDVKIELEDNKGKTESGSTKPLKASAKANESYIENISDEKILVNTESIDNDKLNEGNGIPTEKPEIPGEVITSVKTEEKDSKIINSDSNLNDIGKAKDQLNPQISILKKEIEDKKSSPFDVQKTDDVADKKHVTKENSITIDTKTKSINTNIKSNNNNDSKEISASKNADDNKEILASGKAVIETDSQKSNSEVNNGTNIKSDLSGKINLSDNQLNDNIEDNLINNKKDDSGNSKDEGQFSQSKGDNFFNSYLNKIEMNNVQSAKRPDYKENFDDQMKRVDSSELVKEITKLAAGDQKNVVLKLIPEDLGKVKIFLDISNNIIHAHAEVENEAAKILMQNNVDNLKQSLVQQGLQLNSLNISLANHHEQKSNKPYLSKRKAMYNEQIREISDEEARTVSKNYGYNTYEFLA